MRMYVIADGKIENIIEVDGEFSLPGKQIIPATDEGSIGWGWDGVKPVPPLVPELPVVFNDLPRPSFLFMMGKLGITSDDVKNLINGMPGNTQEQIDRKTLYLIVFDNQQTFKRENELLNTLAFSAGLTEKQVDDAWKVAEALSW